MVYAGFDRGRSNPPVAILHPIFRGVDLSGDKPYRVVTIVARGFQKTFGSCRIESCDCFKSVGTGHPASVSVENSLQAVNVR